MIITDVKKYFEIYPWKIKIFDTHATTGNSEGFGIGEWLIGDESVTHLTPPAMYKFKRNNIGQRLILAIGNTANNHIVMSPRRCAELFLSHMIDTSCTQGAVVETNLDAKSITQYTGPALLFTLNIGGNPHSCWVLKNAPRDFLEIRDYNFQVVANLSK